MKITGSVVGGTGESSGSVQTHGKMTSATVSGAVTGGAGEYSGTVVAGGDMGQVR